MDIDLLWALGGWCFLILSNCMAEPKSSSSSQHLSSKSLPNWLQFLSFLFVLLLLINLSHNQLNPSSKPPSMASSEPTTTSAKSSSPFSSSESTTNLNPKKAHNSHTSSRNGKEFGSDAHEVPSGPNPISNR
ncbi:hypothetical protein K1719_016816 [Acacia pycnantha]|nr:hypothetical protein K1719_016816 [Acacia pycnantha]